MRNILVTGATRGLGKAIAEALAETGDARLILAVRDLDAGRKLAEAIGRNTQVVALDLSSATAIQRFVAAWDTPLAALVNNAGGQFHGRTQMSADGVEATLALNHLGPLQLTLGLLPWLQGGTVLNVGSGTHNPSDGLARLFGFRGGRFTSIEALATGKTEARGARQATLERYATSKLLIISTTVELARRYPRVRFLTLDPGLMPGTGLVRSAPWVVRAAWNTVLRWSVPLIPGASTPERSAAAAKRLLLGHSARSGETYGFNALPEPVWAKVTDPDFGREVLDQSIAFLQSGGWLEPTLPGARETDGAAGGHGLDWRLHDVHDAALSVL